METKEKTSTTVHDEAARLLIVAAGIVREDHRRVASIARAEILNKDDIDLSCELDASRKDMCEAFRARFYPTAIRVIAAFGQVYVLTQHTQRLVFEVAR